MTKQETGHHAAMTNRNPMPKHAPARAVLACLAAGLICLSAEAARADITGPFDCVMDPAQVVPVGAAVSGIVAEVLVDRGDSVTAGQVLARLDTSVDDASVALLQARANSEAGLDAQKARRDLVAARRDRVAALVERNVAATEQMEEAEAELVAAEALVAEAELERELAGLELDRANRLLEQRIVRSPLDGLVLARHLNAGEYVSGETRMLTLVKVDPLYVEAFLPVDIYPEISIGMEGVITPDAPIEGSYRARVAVVDRVFDAASGTFGLRLTLDNPDFALPAGHRCLLSFPDAG
ncbi:efflux RND transporter periplasmic adaptor subunit [Oceanomicrobium pacificus]|uniref:Efflux RND transporter periplasmic adaptor subunit n=1 Tax=Oceanomicrobium pacificus TaxID=2692916 RepID=A0A6B0U0D5_9RHOB|nr:efflux RND transporter periplasmic adaptor subunit [Oceanomicrobium pacificus]MXU66703.1 efflux RND transporter periplasmic adaptor subunit [Oceanomicrobium pacificus]